MPLISVIVPVHSVQGYLRQCLDSVLDQTFTDVELIAIDDHSPDHCPEILDEYAERDPRVRVLHLTQSIGPGPARNLALKEATGEYVWFVDSDDWIAEGCLAAIAAKLRQTAPEILLIDHVTVNWQGTVRPNGWRRALAELDTGECFTLAQDERPLSMFTVAWNKVVRHDLLLRTGIRLEAGWYEDLPFTYGLLVAADRIAALGRVCYHYRKRRQDAITQTRSEQHFDVFDQWNRVFARMDALGARADPYRAQIFDRMVWHQVVVQGLPHRLPAHVRSAYFARMSEQYRRYLPPDARPPQGRADRLRRALVARGAYRTFRTLRAVRIVAGKARRVLRVAHRRLRTNLRWLRRAARAATGRAYYAIQRQLPLDRNLAVYAAYWYRGYACNPAAIYETAREMAPAVRGVWIVDRARAASMPPAVPYVVAGTFASYRALARAGWLVNNVNFPDFVVKREGSVHVQTHHGTPVKVMGLDQAAYPVAQRDMDLTDLMRRCDRWDFSISSNAHSTEVWSRAYPCRYETLEYGYPRNDRLARATAAQVAGVRAGLEIAEGTTVVLYAPTYREYDTGFRPALDVEALADALGPDYLFLRRAHYFYRPGAAQRHPWVQDVSSYPGVEDLLLASDVLITDYSSLMFDYAVLDRPIAIYAPDWDTYRRVRGVTFDLLAAPPGVVAMTLADLLDAFRSGEIFADAARKARAQFRARFCALDDGFASERVVRRVFAPALGGGVDT
jgi:CDP-glycerol glycerophosphotransferase